MTSAWHSEYLHSLHLRDKREKQFDDIIDAYTLLASRSIRTPHLSKLQQRCRDLEEEVQTKDRLLQHAQDELVVSSMELNMCEQRLRDVRKENEGLTERLLKVKEREVGEWNREVGV
ncbi:hypothetical protein EX30DRAFT_348874 [Ascodesmis nigricans]|uniref:Autophagy-related protein 16 domain-containing protein n=1 Tax=Ascodesmis nigricans TaxID=341454 RepID=A0A4S2MWC7_9PEZI|nr:hypothetical protein EX30DRAFT_348874 [Ascodesmis nigricans]